jgi:hypothetical protein
MTTNNACNFPNPLDVSNGGLGISSATAYGTVCGGTTSTSPAQVVAPGVGGTVYTSNGAGLLGSYQSAPSAGAFVKLATLTNSGTGNLDFTSLISATYAVYFLNINNGSPSTAWSGQASIYLSTDNGSTWLSTGYTSGMNYIDSAGTTFTNINSTGYWDGGPDFAYQGAFSDYQVWIFNLNTTKHPAMMSSGVFTTSSVAALKKTFGTGVHSTTTPVTAIRVTVGTTSSTIATLYGLKT